MQAEDQNPETPKPVVRKSTISLVWVLPILTAVIGIWLTVKTISEQGTEITISFTSAEGIVAGKTKIKYKDIQVGVVESLQFAEDASHVLLTARISNEASEFLRRDTRFWVVKPKLSLRGISGLSTLISGSYLEMAPGEGDKWQDFVGLDQAPVVSPDAKGTRITLMTDRLGSVDAGVPVYYQGIVVGEVLGYDLSNDEDNIFVYAFIKAPYDQLINGSSRFWNISGLDITVDSKGIKVNSDSMLSIMFGGIAFETPNPSEASELDPEGVVYTLYDNHDQIVDAGFTRKMLFIAFFDGSVRGLNTGAPVEFHGIKVGSVKDIHLEFDLGDSSFRIPVILEIEPERIIARGEASSLPPYELLKSLIERGLRARLQTGSLLTGQLFVDLSLLPDTEAKLIGNNEKYPELPTVPADMDQMLNSAKAIMAKIEKIDFQNISKELQGTLAGSNKLLNNPDLKESLENLKVILKEFGARSGPMAENLDELLTTGRSSLIKLDTTIKLLNAALNPDAPLQYNVIKMSKELSDMARSIRALVDMLEREPDAVIFGKTPPGGEE